MENANRPNGYTVPERYTEVQAGHMGMIVKDADGTVHLVPERDPEDIRVSLGSIRKEIEETNRILRRIEQGLGGKR